MSGPERDINGLVLPHDDPSIEPEHGLIRNVHPRQVVCDPKSPVETRYSSGLFSASTEAHYGVSVNLEHPIIEDGLNALDFVPKGLGAARLTASQAREPDLLVGSSPVLEPEPNPYHGEIWNGGKRKLSLGQKKALARSATVLKFVEPASE